MKSTLHISADALRANFQAIQRAAGPDFELFCVLKANAYGHGLALCAPILVEAGARWLGVADLEEGIVARRALLHAGLADRPVHIVTMCGLLPEDAPGLLEHALTPVIWTPGHVHALEQAAAAMNQRIAVHLELDTGMSRQGAAPGLALAALLSALQHAPHVRAEGVFSHLSCSEVADSRETTKQLTLLGPALEQLAETDFLPEYLHLGNSSALDEGSTLSWVQDFAHNDLSATPLLRPGLALYGYTLPLAQDGSASPPDTVAANAPPPSLEHRPAASGDRQPALSPHLQPVATWTAPILALRSLLPGDTVGYGATFTAPAPMRVALLAVGYADGLRREASSGLGNGWVMVNGQPAPVLGRVSMNLVVVDVTQHTPAPQPGDSAVLLGPGVTAHDHARWADTIPYEILCGLRGHHRLA